MKRRLVSHRSQDLDAERSNLAFWSQSTKSARRHLASNYPRPRLLPIGPDFTASYIWLFKFLVIWESKQQHILHAGTCTKSHSEVGIMMQKLGMPRSHRKVGLWSALAAQKKDAHSDAVSSVCSAQIKTNSSAGDPIGKSGSGQVPPSPSGEEQAVAWSLSQAMIFIVPPVGPGTEMTLGCFPVPRAHLERIAFSCHLWEILAGACSLQLFPTLQLQNPAGIPEKSRGNSY